MSTTIQDGTGTKIKAGVTINNRLLVDSVQRSEREETSIMGESYIMGTGFVTLTGTTPSSILYFKNNGDEDLVITRFIVSVRKSTGGTEDHIRGIIYKNPTSMSNGTGVDLIINNINFGSSNTIESSSEIGKEGTTLNGGTTFLSTVAPTEQITSEDAATIIPRGSSIGVSIIPPAGNTSIQVGVGINIHKLL